MFHRIWFLRLIIFMKLMRISIIMFSRMRNEGAVSETQYAVENVGVIKLRIVRRELIVLAARFSRSQRDNCSIFPLICETPRGLPHLLAARRVVERQREKKTEMYT